MKSLIWDLPTRIFHWFFAGSVVAAFFIAQLAKKETPFFYLHVVFGVLAGLLILWRLLWGLVGSKHARLKELLCGPKKVLGYFRGVLQGKGEYHAGHNPGGAWGVLALLLMVALTVVSGIFITQSELFEESHEVLPFVVMGLAGVHVAGVLLATRMNGENYVLSMIHGMKKASGEEGLQHSHKGMALVMVAMVFLPWAYFVQGFDRNTALFKAPGTQWTFQVGEPEYEEGSDQQLRGNEASPQGQIKPEGQSVHSESEVEDDEDQADRD